MFAGILASKIETTREFLFFLAGVCCSQEHLHGYDLGGFTDYLSNRFDRSRLEGGWLNILLKEFGNKPFGESLDTVRGLLQAWFAMENEKTREYTPT
jgi:hypothetical protein